MFVRHVRRRHFKPVLFLRIPGNAQHLHPPLGKLDHILLNWVDAKRVFDLEVADFAVRSFGVHPELAVATKEPRRGAEPLKRGVVKVTQNGVFSGQLHRPIVVRALPLLLLRLVAFGTRRPPDVFRRTHRLRRQRRKPIPPELCRPDATIPTATTAFASFENFVMRSEQGTGERWRDLYFNCSFCTAPCPRM